MLLGIAIVIGAWRGLLASEGESVNECSTICTRLCSDINIITCVYECEVLRLTLATYIVLRLINGVGMA